MTLRRSGSQEDHNHNNNPSNGSNWKNLYIHCHDNEHSRFLDHRAERGLQVEDDEGDTMTHRLFAGLKGLLRDEKK